MSTTVVVIMARRLTCRYPGDECYKHDGSDRHHKREDGFQTCENCEIRRVAEAVHLPGPPSRVPA